jgi:hypothetical protein
LVIPSNQFASDLPVVVDLAVEHENDLTIIADHRLLAAGQIDHTKSPVSHGDGAP